MTHQICKKIKSKIKNYIFIKRNFSEYDKFQWKSAEEIERIRTKKLKDIVKKAVDFVPFYKNLDLKIDFENFSLDELKKFPVINKQVIKENFKDFCSIEFNGKASHTSGSTGTPFEFIVPFESDAIEKITSNRAWSMGKDYTYKSGDQIIVLRTYSPKEGEPLYKISGDYWYLSPFHINESNLALYLFVIEKSKAKIIRGYASSIYIFTLLLKQKNIKIPQIKTIVTSSETLLPAYRSAIEEYWRLPVLDWYGQNERTVTVQQCWAGNYHNNDDYGIVELSDKNEIIATSLNNYVMPFIRYNTGDKAIPLDGKAPICPCGRHLSIPFKGIEGRSDDILIKDDGTAIPTANFSTAMKNFSDLRQFQIIQDKDRSVTLKVVLDNDSSQYVNLIASEVYRRLGNIKLNIEKVPQIGRDVKTGKIKVTIQKGELV
jgi:putative capsular polysaccharide biosynthesis protein